jgi:transposase
MKQKHSWEITDEFWSIAEPLIPKKTRNPDKTYQRKQGGGRRSMEPRTALQAIFYVLRTGIQWKALPPSFGSSTAISCFGLNPAFLRLCGHAAYKSMMKSKASAGHG